MSQTLEGHTTRPRGLVLTDFMNVARNGFGDPQNAYAHSMAWFRNHLYVTTTRNVMAAPRPFYRELEKVLNVYPIRHSEISPWDNDYASEIWRYSPVSGEWQQVYKSPMFISDEGFEVPRQVGFRSMAVHQGKDDAEPALYAASWATRMGPGPIVMRCADGATFEEACAPGFGGLTSQGVRGLASFKGRLFAGTTGRSGSRDMMPDQMLVLESENPAGGEWQIACQPHFGDPANLSIYEMHVFNDHLYAATLNSSTGFQLWKTDAEGPRPYRWKCVLSHGAYRGNLNQTLMSMAVLDGALYVGSAIQNCGHDRVFGVGPAAPEVIRVSADDSWDLLVGVPRSTPDGLKLPLSGLGPGFDNEMAGYLWRLCAHDGWLYATTADRTTFLPFVTASALPDYSQWLFESDAMENTMREFGGFELWRTRDGVNWSPVTRNGFGNQYNLGGRTLVSSPYGLFVGTANLFGPTVAVKREAGWTYERNPDGGTEVWLGAQSQTSDAGSAPPLATGLPSVCPRESTPEKLVEEFFDDSGFEHCGYWKVGTDNAQGACESLIDEMAAFSLPRVDLRIPVPTNDDQEREFFTEQMKRSRRAHLMMDHPRQAAVMDLACGSGATTRSLLRYFAPESLVGVTSSKARLRECQVRTSGVRFEHMKLPRLKFAPASFDYVFCAEQMNRLGPRKKTLQNVLRVLRKGGMFIGADILKVDTGLCSPDETVGESSARIVKIYSELLSSAGLFDVQVMDVTLRTVMRFRDAASSFLGLKLMAGEIDDATVKATRAALPGFGETTGIYVLFAGRKSRGGASA